MEEFLAGRAEKVEHLRTSEDVVVSKVGRELYEKFFRGYTRKQWGLDPSELDAQVTARVPTRTNRDDRYFTDTYQAMPKYGFTRMFGNLLDHPNIRILLNTASFKKNTRRWRTPRKAFTSWGGWRLIATTTWTRWSRRR